MNIGAISSGSPGWTKRSTSKKDDASALDQLHDLLYETYHRIV